MDASFVVEVHSNVRGSNRLRRETGERQAESSSGGKFSLESDFGSKREILSSFQSHRFVDRTASSNLACSAS
jgi:hypothetical protein